MNRKILIVEDCPDIGTFLLLHLKDLGCEADLAGDGLRGLDMARTERYDLIILDLTLPGLGGLEVCRKLRAETDYTPILMLSAKSSEVDRVVGLEIGADDYLTKPFSVSELLARVKAIFRRVDAFCVDRPEAPKRITLGAMCIDVGKRTVTVSGRPVELTAREFDLLLHFAEHPGRVYSRQQLLDRVWGSGHVGYEHTVNSHINRLRGKIEANPAAPEYVLTVWGVGYKFSDGLAAGS